MTARRPVPQRPGSAPVRADTGDDGRRGTTGTDVLNEAAIDAEEAAAQVSGTHESVKVPSNARAQGQRHDQTDENPGLELCRRGRSFDRLRTRLVNSDPKRAAPHSSAARNPANPGPHGCPMGHIWDRWRGRWLRHTAPTPPDREIPSCA